MVVGAAAATTMVSTALPTMTNFGATTADDENIVGNLGIPAS